jgi:ElaB/YqjD/DUF883 family membrane-anchored ribosome-binding protein
MATSIETKLKDTIHARTDAAAQAAHNIVDRVAKRAEVSEEKLRESAEIAQRKLQHSVQSARVRGLDAKKSVTDFMRRHPIASLSFAFGIGALLASRGKRSVETEIAERSLDKPNDREEKPVH